jgi:hypothetical protein
VRETAMFEVMCTFLALLGRESRGWMARRKLPNWL